MRCQNSFETGLFDYISILQPHPLRTVWMLFNRATPGASLRALLARRQRVKQKKAQERKVMYARPVPEKTARIAKT
jgi:hypothetical protein